MISVNRINIFDEIISIDNQEISELLLRSGGTSANLRIERIVSNGVASPSGFWYDQDFNEWCCLVCGKAVLQTENQNVVTLNKGDSCFLPSHFRHRVESVSEDAIWITVCWH